MEEYLKRTLKQFKDNESAISMFLGGLVVIVVGILLFNYFRSDRPQPSISKTSEATESAEYTLSFDTDETGQAIPEKLPREHVVVKQENLWNIAEKYYGSGYNFVDIAEVNNLTDPNKLNAGMKLTIPQVPVRQPQAKLSQKNTEASAAASLSDSKSYVVQKGENLWDIAVSVYGDGYQWPSIFQANKDVIKDPSLIDTGWSLTIPPLQD